MNKKQQWALFCGRLVPFASVAAVFFMTFAVLFAYEKGSNYFEPNSLIPSLAVIWAMIAFAAAVVFAIILPKEKLKPSSPFGSSLLLALPAALGFGIGAIFMVAEFAKNQATLVLITALFLLLSAAYVLLCETSARKNGSLALLGFLPPLACALLVGVLYFDASLEMNAPLKVATQCALLPFMLYFTAELRYLLDRALPRLYLALALGSVAASSLCILSVPVASLMGVLSNTNCLAAALTVAGLNVTVLLRLKRFLQPPPAPDENNTKETDVQ